MLPSKYWNQVLSHAEQQFCSGEIDADDFQAVVDVALLKHDSVTVTQLDGTRKVFFSRGYTPPEGAPKPVISEGFTAAQALFALLGAFGIAGRAGSAAKKIASAAGAGGTAGAGHVPTKPATDVLKKKKSDGAASDAGRNERRQDMLRDRAKGVVTAGIPAVAATTGVMALKEHFPEIWQAIEDFLQPLVDAINDILHTIRDNIPYIVEQIRLIGQAMQEIVKMYVQNLGPSLEQLRHDVIQPWLNYVHEGMDAVSKLQADLAVARQRSDSSDPAIVAPNYSAQDLMRMSIAMNTPFIRDLARGIINSEQILRYQAATSRGYGNPLDAWLAAGNTVNPASAAVGAYQALETAARVPDWFIRR